MDLDFTLFIQLGLFCIVLLVVESVLLRPLLRVIEERRRRIDGAKAQATVLLRQIEQDDATYQARLRAARREALQTREALRHAGRDEERRLVDEARATVAETLDAARGEVTVAEKKAREALSGDVAALAQQIVEKLLGRKVA